MSKKQLSIEAVAGSIIIIVCVLIVLSSCSTRRVGCPVNAQTGFGYGRIR